MLLLMDATSPDLLSLVFSAISVLIVVCSLKFFIRLYQVRTLVRNVSKKHGIPIIPHSFLFGHLITIGRHMAKYPSNLHGQCLPIILQEFFPDICARGLVYLDVWPISPPMLAVFHPDMMSQYTVDQSMPKHEHLHHELQPFTQCLDLVSSEGQLWKTWRGIFNPGFSAKNLIQLVPDMVEEIEVFRDLLKAAAISDKKITLAQNAEKLTIDIIGRTVLGSRLHSQTMPNSFYKALKDQTSWLITDNQPGALFSRNWNPIRPLMVWNNNRIMKDYLSPLIQEMLMGGSEYGGPKTILSLAIGAYKQGAFTNKTLDSTFMDILQANLKIFMLAGHDTTASILSYVYYVLSTNTMVRNAVRCEHDAVFGPNPAAVTAKIIAAPTLLNQLPYTVAVIKETLRLFPPFGTIRAGSTDFFLVHPDTGERYPTDGMMVFGCSVAMHRLEEFWPEPNRCIPDRWLVPEGHPLHPRKNTFRPFELGPRNCIGQEMAMLELRMILAMTVRDFDIDSNFPPGSPRALGELAYQTMQPGQLSAYPKDGMPVRVKLRKNEIMTTRFGNVSDT